MHKTHNFTQVQAVRKRKTLCPACLIMVVDLDDVYNGEPRCRGSGSSSCSSLGVDSFLVLDLGLDIVDLARLNALFDCPLISAVSSPSGRWLRSTSGGLGGPR